MYSCFEFFLFSFLVWQAKPHTVTATHQSQFYSAPESQSNYRTIRLVMENSPKLWTTSSINRNERIWRNQKNFVLNENYCCSAIVVVAVVSPGVSIRSINKIINSSLPPHSGAREREKRNERIEIQINTEYFENIRLYKQTRFALITSNTSQVNSIEIEKLLQLFIEIVIRVWKVLLKYWRKKIVGQMMKIHWISQDWVPSSNDVNRFYDLIRPLVYT